MGLLELFNQWIIERGSAVVQEKHIALFRDQLVEADKINLALESENSILKNKVETLAPELHEARQEIKRLNDVIETHREKQDISKLDDVTEDILKIFFNAGRELSVRDFGNFPSNVVRYHFDLLLKDGLITQTKTDFEPLSEETTVMYDLTPSGRKYIFENKST